MEFRILGPLEVDEDGRPISIRRGKEQALLAYLLLHANEVVPSGTLIDVLWDERPPATASKILQNGVSHLRKQLGDGRLETRDPGYLLRVEKDELDLERFERLARGGHEAEALALWRGTPLLDLREERFADEARRRLEEQRLAVIEDRVDADLAAGRHADLIPEPEALVSANALRKRPVGQLMLALYRAGRQSDALEAYQRARRRLSEELGLEPGPQLQEIERRILTHDPELAAPPSLPRRAAPKPRRPRKLLLFGVVAAALVAAAAFGLSRAFSGSAAPVVQLNSLVVVDPSRNRIVDVVPVGHTPRGVAVGRDYVWLANSADGTISQIEKKSLKHRPDDWARRAGHRPRRKRRERLGRHGNRRHPGAIGRYLWRDSREAASLVEGPNGERSRGHRRCRGDLGRIRRGAPEDRPEKRLRRRPEASVFCGA